ncbi:uncharacterized protein NECHADRAFT_89038 [Fusarium vanettenii 77-13-4]|uniref:Uncharacterized protein n=1 Tax=Fusarium vanettenii (strain ATCC MYA-4622 / CBS 123669 / FGSC 9596 / NRRL 45880 / 77-13-4) TaxID=660122 RepID=C7ZPZ3_FUSV7|nr:uncharacterized protein NECHADRAFT_89038 [Fusarium vanettenii 77-13-4]EEU33905.1 predicted protein [Fusarium vanettenii 77-13-4]
MGTLTPQDRTRLRARQIQRFHASHLEKGPHKFAEIITTTDLDLARTLQPTWKHLGTDDCEYPENWALKKASLETALRSFRKNAEQMIAGHAPKEVDVEAEVKGQDRVVDATAIAPTMEDLPSPLRTNRQEMKASPLALIPTDQGYQNDEAVEDGLDIPADSHLDHIICDGSFSRISPRPAFISGGLNPTTHHETTPKATRVESPSRYRQHYEPECNTHQSTMTMTITVLQARVEAKDKELDKLDDTVINLSKECANWKRIAGEKEKVVQDTIKKLDATQKKLRQAEKDRLVLIDKENDLVEKLKNMELELAKTKQMGQGRETHKKQQDKKSDSILTPSNLERLQALMVKAGVERG